MTRNFYNLKFFISGVLILGITSYLVSFFNTSNSVYKLQFILLNLILWSYLALEGLKILIEKPFRPYLHPLIIVIALFYLMMHLVPNLRLIFDVPSEHLPFRMIFWDDIPYKAFNKTMLLLILSAYVMFLGYKNKLTESMAIFFRDKIKTVATFTSEKNVGLPLICIIIAAGVLSFVVQINLGIYGYGISDEVLRENASSAQTFRYIDQAQLVCIMILAYSLHSSKEPLRRERFIFYILLAFLILQGFLFGSKGKVIFPLLAAGMAAYAYSGKIIKTYVISTTVILAIAFITIEPYRIVKNIYPDATFMESLSLLREVPETLQTESIEEDVTLYDRLEDFTWWLVGRSDNFSFSANAIEFKDRYGIPDNDNPDFVGSIIYSPILAFVPRFIWKNKPRDQIGLWYENTIMQSPFYSASAFGAIGYSYYAGGTIAVALIFLFFGICQRILYECFFKLHNLQGFLLYIALIIPVTLISSEVGGVITGFIRLIPIALFGIFLIFFDYKGFFRKIFLK